MEWNVVIFESHDFPANFKNGVHWVASNGDIKEAIREFWNYLIIRYDVDTIKEAKKYVRIKDIKEMTSEEFTSFKENWDWERVE